MNPAINTISVKVGDLQRLLQETRQAKAPTITWNESPVVMHERADKKRRESLDTIEGTLETILGPVHTLPG